MHSNNDSATQDRQVVASMKICCVQAVMMLVMFACGLGLMITAYQWQSPTVMSGCTAIGDSVRLTPRDAARTYYAARVVCDAAANATSYLYSRDAYSTGNWVTAHVRTGPIAGPVCSNYQQLATEAAATGAPLWWTAEYPDNAVCFGPDAFKLYIGGVVCIVLCAVALVGMTTSWIVACCSRH